MNNSALDTLAAFAIVFALGVVSTLSLSKHNQKIRETQLNGKIHPNNTSTIVSQLHERLRAYIEQNPHSDTSE